MKRTFITALALIFSVSISFSQSSEKPDVPEITFEKLVHNYGTVIQNSDGKCEFKFTNTGNKPLILSNVTSSCGCTVPSWPREPIMPGTSESIKVKYDTRRLGPINKQVTVRSNASRPTMVLSIKGKVVPKPKEVMPTQNLDEGSTPIAN